MRTIINILIPFCLTLAIALVLQSCAPNPMGPNMGDTNTNAVVNSNTNSSTNTTNTNSGGSVPAQTTLLLSSLNGNWTNWFYGATAAQQIVWNFASSSNFLTRSITNNEAIYANCTLLSKNVIIQNVIKFAASYTSWSVIPTNTYITNTVWVENGVLYAANNDLGWVFSRTDSVGSTNYQTGNYEGFFTGTNAISFDHSFESKRAVLVMTNRTGTMWVYENNRTNIFSVTPLFSNYITVGSTGYVCASFDNGWVLAVGAEPHKYVVYKK